MCTPLTRFRHPILLPRLLVGQVFYKKKKLILFFELSAEVQRLSENRGCKIEEGCFHILLILLTEECPKNFLVFLNEKNKK